MKKICWYDIMSSTVRFVTFLITLTKIQITPKVQELRLICSSMCSLHLKLYSFSISAQSKPFSNSCCTSCLLASQQLMNIQYIYTWIYFSINLSKFSLKNTLNNCRLPELQTILWISSLRKQTEKKSKRSCEQHMGFLHSLMTQN